MFGSDNPGRARRVRITEAGGSGLAAADSGGPIVRPGARDGRTAVLRTLAWSVAGGWNIAGISGFGPNRAGWETETARTASDAGRAVETVRDVRGTLRGFNPHR